MKLKKFFIVEREDLVGKYLSEAEPVKKPVQKPTKPNPSDRSDRSKRPTEQKGSNDAQAFAEKVRNLNDAEMSDQQKELKAGMLARQAVKFAKTVPNFVKDYLAAAKDVPRNSVVRSVIHQELEKVIPMEGNPDQQKPLDKNAKPGEEGVQQKPPAPGHIALALKDIKNKFEGTSDDGKEVKKTLTPGSVHVYNELFKEIDKLETVTDKKKKAELANDLISTYDLSLKDDGSLLVGRAKDVEPNGKEELKKALGPESSSAIVSYLKMAGADFSPLSSEKEPKAKLADVSKVNLGKGTSATDSPFVQELFETGPLETIGDGFKQVYLPTDDEGRPIHNKKGMNASLYFKHSVEENKGLAHAIRESDKLASEGKVPRSIPKILKAHQDRMKKILNSNTVPSSEAQNEVGDSYATLATELHKADKNLASSMMKNFGEMALYDSSIAAGEEVYLPSHNRFPSGDLIKITRNGTKVEKISSISVKWGKAGEFGQHGFPGEASKYQLYHPDPEKRDYLNNTPGRDGWTIGIKDSLIDKPSGFKSILKKSGGIGEAVKDHAGFTSMLKEYKEKHAEIVATHGLGLGKEKLIKNDEAYAKKMASYIDEEKLNDVLGSDNATLAMSKGPSCLSAMIVYGHLLETSKGLPMLEHNHQEYVDGKYYSKTNTSKDGTDSPRNWAFRWRPYDGRGLAGSFNEKRKYMGGKEKGRYTDLRKIEQTKGAKDSDVKIAQKGLESMLSDKNTSDANMEKKLDALRGNRKAQALLVQHLSKFNTPWAQKLAKKYAHMMKNYNLR